MFTGLIETVGSVVAARPTPAGRSLSVDVSGLNEAPPLGASIAVNGVCLSVAGLDGRIARFDVIGETLACTTLSELRVGGRVNLEPSLRAGDRLEGHIVQGHVEHTAIVDRVQNDPADWRLWLRVEMDLMRYMIPKGSVAIDGVSLTLADVHADHVAVALVPTTLGHTTLGERRSGDRVNVEPDLFARIVVDRLDALAAGGGLTLEALQQHGFA